MMIRKAGLIFVVVVPLLALGWLYVARNALVAGVAELALERMLDTDVQIEGVDLQPFAMRATFQRLRIVDADAPGRYLLVAGPAAFDLNGLQLFARKFVVDELSVDGLGFDQPRPNYTPPPAPPPQPKPAPEAAPAQPPGGDADPGDMPEAAWSLNIPLPELDLSALEQELDVGRITGGQPLASVQALDKAQADSSARLSDLQSRVDNLNAQQRLDAIQAKVQGLKLDSKDPRELQAALKGLREAADAVKALRAETQALSRDIQAEPGRLREDIARANRELDADVAAAMRLAKLGGLNAGQVGALVFGPVVLERFNWVLARFQQVRGMMGSDREPPSEPPRRAGRLISFPVTARAYPGFLVETIGFTGSSVDESGAETLRYTGRLTGLSSDARVYGQPMLLEATAANKAGAAWVVRGSFDHRESPGLDRVTAQGKGVRLDDLRLSGGSLPERAVSRDADVNLAAQLQGGALEASLRIDANQVQFVFADGAASGATQRAIRDVFADLDRVTLQATLGGSLRHPRMRISSSIDEVFARRMREVLGKRRAEAEARIRGQLEARVAERRNAVQQAAAERRQALEARVAQAEQRVRDYEKQLAQRHNAAEQRLKGAARGKADDALQRLRKR